MLHARTTTRELVKGTPPKSYSPPPGEKTRCELWIRRGRSPWRSDYVGTYAALKLRGIKALESMEERGLDGEVFIAAIGDFPDMNTPGHFKTGEERDI